MQFTLKKDFKELKTRFNLFSEIETISQIQEIYLPKVKDLSLKMDSLFAENENIREAMVEIDRDISQKATWSSLTILREEIERKYFLIESTSELYENLNTLTEN